MSSVYYNADNGSAHKATGRGRVCGDVGVVGGGAWGGYWLARGRDNESIATHTHTHAKGGTIDIIEGYREQFWC